MRLRFWKRPTFGIIGLGFIAQKHLQAIKDVGGKLMYACDIDMTKAHKVEGTKFFTNWLDIVFDKDFDKLDYVVICTPNDLHYPMANYFASLGKQVLIEKPPVLNSQELEWYKAHDKDIHLVVQLRLNPELIALKKSIEKEKKYEASFAVCVHRDDWYFKSWKNDPKQSGGLLYNIGIHYFDLLCWLFGKPISQRVTEVIDLQGHLKGEIEFKNCKAKWELSILQPIDNQYRYLRVDGRDINLTNHFEDLHTRVYRQMLKGKSVRISDIEPTIKLLDDLCQFI